MTVEIGDIIKSYLTSLTFIDKLAGVVTTINKVDMDKDNRQVRKTFPVACGMSYEECTTNGKYLDLVPNSNLKAIVYLEDNGINKIGVNGANTVYRASYLMVGWLNLKKLGKTNCSISGQVITTILSKLPVNPFDSGIYKRIDIEVGGQRSKQEVPFRKYSYNEDITQYLMHPYDYFAIPIEATFQINPSCVTEFEESTAINCN